MGLNMVTRLERGGHDIVVYDRSTDAVTKAVGVKASGTSSLAEGARVSYEAEAGDKGPRAVNVQEL